jgi:hypothetical protein
MYLYMARVSYCLTMSLYPVGEGANKGLVLSPIESVMYTLTGL